jgi:plastocyanin
MHPLLCSAVLALMLAGCSSAPKPRAVPVAIEGFTYTSAALAVAPGDTVVWTNHDLVPHTVTARNGAFDSGSIASGGSWRYVAQEAETLEYYCTFHPTMQATLTVG